MKTCRKCGSLLEIAENFYRHSKMADGYLNICKRCVLTRVTIHRGENIDRIRKYDRRRGSDKRRIAAAIAYQRAHPEIKAKGQRSYRSRHPERHSAHVATAKAIRDGLLVRQPCEVCGVRPAEAHHDDYSNALDVRWLCDEHHRQHHREQREIMRQRSE